MRFIILHRTNARWEAGEIPDAGLIADVGAMIGDLKNAGVLRAGEGLRASSKGARITYASGTGAVAPGPFAPKNELPAGFDIIRVPSLNEAVAWANEIGQVLGDVELDVRPVTEPWDIGLAPKPAGVSTERFMVLRKATPETESGAPLAPAKRAALAKLRAAKGHDHLGAETMRPSARGRRCKNTSAGIAFTDGPFTESKELIAGYVIVEVPSLDDASRWAARYVTSVRADEADVLELEDATPPTP